MYIILVKNIVITMLKYLHISFICFYLQRCNSEAGNHKKRIAS